MADVFTSAPLEGNQLAVFPDARRIPEGMMQTIAKEMNFPETVFVLPAEGNGTVRVRIFTPATELPFAGHPTLGTSFLLGELLQLDRVVLETGAGPIPVALERADGQLVFGRMDQPIPSPTRIPFEGPLLAALGVNESLLPVEAYQNGPFHVFVCLESEAAVAALGPDFNALLALPPHAANCFAGSGTRWKTRMFAPSAGINEDPATGSAAGPLALHLGRHGRVPFGQQIEITQGVEVGRPSRLYATAFGTTDKCEGIEVGGSAVIIASGELRPLV